ncbi:4'-phosphopantetheinyl transferase family protein [Latilactobacillus sakei]
MIYTCKIDFKKEAQRYQFLLSKIDNDRKILIENFIQLDDKLRSLLSRKLAEHAVCNFANVQESSLSFGNDHNGKPVLLSHPYIHFNLSHCGDWIVCAVDERPVGVDIEKIVSWNLDTLEIFCDSSEVNNLITNQYQNQRYFQYWTIKEAMLKKVGVGLLNDPREVFVSFLDNHQVTATFNNECLYGESICTNDGYILSAINTTGVLDTLPVCTDDFYKGTYSQ